MFWGRNHGQFCVCSLNPIAGWVAWENLARFLKMQFDLAVVKHGLKQRPSCLHGNVQHGDHFEQTTGTALPDRWSKENGNSPLFVGQFFCKLLFFFKRGSIYLNMGIIVDFCGVFPCSYVVHSLYRQSNVKIDQRLLAHFIAPEFKHQFTSVATMLSLWGEEKNTRWVFLKRGYPQIHNPKSSINGYPQSFSWDVP